MQGKEQTWDEILGIQTTGRDESGADTRHHPYEPTPYCVLERLAGSGLLKNGDVVLDYGCGKGRVGFFLSAQGLRTIGIEYDRRIYAFAAENRKTAASGSGADFALAKAEEYPLPGEVNRCYFFNPFSCEILRKVMARILESYYDEPREILLFFYYPADEYVAFLMTVDQLEFYDEIDCRDLFGGSDPRERILIFTLPGYEDYE